MASQAPSCSYIEVTDGSLDGSVADSVGLVDYGAGKGEGLQALEDLSAGTAIIDHDLTSNKLKAANPDELAELVLAAGNNRYFLKLPRDEWPGSFGLVARKDDGSGEAGSGSLKAAENGKQDAAFAMTPLFYISHRRHEEAQALAAKTGHNFEDCCRALHTVHSRSVFVTSVGKFALIPGLEYLNHSSSPNAEIVHGESGRVCVRLSTPIKRGDEVFISYGSHSTDVFVGQYFFVPDANECDTLYLNFRREALLLKLAKHDAAALAVSPKGFIPFGFIRADEPSLMEFAKAVDPDSPERLIRSRLERSKFLWYMKVKQAKQADKITGLSKAHSDMWVQYLEAKMALVIAALDRLQ